MNWLPRTNIVNISWIPLTFVRIFSDSDIFPLERHERLNQFEYYDSLLNGSVRSIPFHIKRLRNRYKWKKRDKSCYLSLLAEYHLRLSNRFIEDFKRVVAFSACWSQPKSEPEKRRTEALLKPQVESAAPYRRSPSELPIVPQQCGNENGPFRPCHCECAGTPLPWQVSEPWTQGTGSLSNE